MSKCSSLASMIGVVGHGECGDTYDRFNRSYVNRVFMEIGMADSVPVDILPCLNGVEVEFIRRDADNGAVLVMQEFVLECDAAF